VDSGNHRGHGWRFLSLHGISYDRGRRTCVPQHPHGMLLAFMGCSRNPEPLAMSNSDLPAPPDTARGPHNGARDAYIAGRLVTAYALSEDLAPFDLRVEVADGVVTLGGTVDDKVLRELAIEIARDVDEVEEVVSELVVECPAPHGRGTGNGFSRRFN